MPVLGAVIAGVGAIGGGLIASGGAKSAANTQAQAAADAQAAQERMFEKQIALQEPYRQGGLTAQNRLLTLLGLNPNAGQPAASGGTPRAYQTPYGMINVPAMGGAGAPATNAQGIVVDPKSPDFGKYARDFGMQDFVQDPGYEFRLAEGQKAIERSAAARGGLQSGAALKAAARYGQDMGSQEYANAFNRYQTNRSNQLNPLFALMNTGIGAANNLTNAAGQQAQSQADNIYNAGNAMASGQVGSANAWGSAFGNIANSLGSAVARSSSYGGRGRLNSALNSGSGYFPSSRPSWNGEIDVGTPPYLPTGIGGN
jgi:hypothetical protein